MKKILILLAVATLPCRFRLLPAHGCARAARATGSTAGAHLLPAGADVCRPAACAAPCAPTYVPSPCAPSPCAACRAVYAADGIDGHAAIHGAARPRR